jgi:hypothetical protein
MSGYGFIFCQVHEAQHVSTKEEHLLGSVLGSIRHEYE